MPSNTLVTTGPKTCKPFMLQVMVFSPETGYKFTIEIQKACSPKNDPIWKLIFDLYKKTGNDFVELIAVTFVAGDPNDIEKVAAITDQGMTRAQVRAFRENVYPMIKTIGDTGKTPSANEQKTIDTSVKSAIHAG